jgi:apolipoprotein N-acyltransferase
MALAQPPVSVPWVLFLALPALLWLMDGTKGPGAAFGLGWAAGAGYFGAGLFWIVEPFLVEPEVFGWMAPFALVGMAAGMALYWAAAFGLARLRWPAGPGRVLLLASAWTLADFARAHLLTGFPWALIGYAWVETPVIQAAALFGPYMLGFLTLVAAMLPGLATARGAAAALALVAAGWGFGAWRLAEPPPREPAVRVRLVQPNAAQELKWRPGMAAEFWRRHLALSRAPGDPDVVIWSETAAPFVLGEAPELQAEAVAAAAPARLVAGIRRTENGRWFNSLAAFGPDGGVLATYDKHHLVPFGEYVPLAPLVARLGLPALTTLTRAGFSAGPGPRLMAVPGLPPFLPLICYEAIFPDAMRAPEGRPEWMVQVTNDAWFGRLAGPHQHLAQARVRAVEQGLPLARAANTGISAMVDPFGRVTARLELGAEGFVDADLPGALPAPPYARSGDLPALFALVTIFGLTFGNFYDGFFRGRR